MSLKPPVLAFASSHIRNILFILYFISRTILYLFYLLVLLIRPLGVNMGGMHFTRSLHL